MAGDERVSEGKKGRLLKLSEVSEILNVTVPTVRNWCNQGKIRYVRLPNRHRRIPAEEIERILNGGMKNDGRSDVC